MQLLSRATRRGHDGRGRFEDHDLQRLRSASAVSQPELDLLTRFQGRDPGWQRG